MGTMNRTNFNRIPGLSSFMLSQMVPHLQFFRPSVRYPLRQDGLKKAVLRALCDRYPNVWPSLGDIARKTGYSLSKIRRALRELELKDRLVEDINARYKWATDQCGRRVLTAVSDGKNGGRGKNCTAQYVINDRKIVDIYQAVQKTKTRSWENKLAPGNRVSGLNSLRGSDEHISINKPSSRTQPNKTASLGVRCNRPGYLDEPFPERTPEGLAEIEKINAAARQKIFGNTEPMAASAAA